MLRNSRKRPARPAASTQVPASALATVSLRGAFFLVRWRLSPAWHPQPHASVVATQERGGAWSPRAPNVLSGDGFCLIVSPFGVFLSFLTSQAFLSFLKNQFKPAPTQAPRGSACSGPSRLWQGCDPPLPRTSLSTCSPSRSRREKTQSVWLGVREPGSWPRWLRGSCTPAGGLGSPIGGAPSPARPRPWLHPEGPGALPGLVPEGPSLTGHMNEAVLTKDEASGPGRSAPSLLPGSLCFVLFYVMLFYLFFHSCLFSGARSTRTPAHLGLCRSGCRTFCKCTLSWTVCVPPNLRIRVPSAGVVCLEARPWGAFGAR